MNVQGLLLVLCLMVTSINGDYKISVRFHSYNNFASRCYDCGSPAGCCDNHSNKGTCSGNERCDTYFRICLNSLPLEQCTDIRKRVTTAVNVDDRAIDFSQGTFLNVRNPITFPGFSQYWEIASYFISVYDDDGSQDNLIDSFRITLSPGNTRVGVYTSPTTYFGRHNIARLQLSFLVECTENFSGPTCGVPITQPPPITTPTVPVTTSPVETETTKTVTTDVTMVSTVLEETNQTTVTTNMLPTTQMQTTVTTNMLSTTQMPTTLPTSGEPELTFIVAGIGGGLVIVGVCIIIILLVICVVLRRRASPKREIAQTMSSNPNYLPEVTFNRNRGLSTMNSAVSLPLPSHPECIKVSDTNNEENSDAGSYVYEHMYDFIQDS